MNQRGEFTSADKNQFSLQRNENVVNIDKGNAIYTILYGMHIVTQNPKELPEDIDAILLETGMHRWADNPVKTINTLRNHVQYRDLFQTLEKKKIPVLFGDVKYKYNDHLLLVADQAAATLGWIGGMKMARSVLEDIGVLSTNDKKQKKVSVKTGMNLAIGAWLMLPFASSFATMISSTTGVGRDAAARMKKLSHSLHPEAELLYLIMRNAIIAEKEEFYTQLLGKKMHLATVLGAAHVGIEDMLKEESETRQKYFERFSFLLKQLVIPEYFHTLVKMDYNGRKWNIGEIYEIPALQQFIA